MGTDPADLRVSYERGALVVGDLAGHPMTTLARWLDEAIADGLPEPNAMTLATVDARARADARVVLCKGVDEHGVVFFTNTTSAKGQQLDANPACALVFVWLAHERQVRVRGWAERVADIEADAYFASRPRGSRLGAWASPQSEVIGDRKVLDDRLADAERRFGTDETDGPVPRPPTWTGYRVVPEEVEFWQGRPSRLHDRLRATRQPEGWRVVRLAP